MVTLSNGLAGTLVQLTFGGLQTSMSTMYGKHEASSEASYFYSLLWDQCSLKWEGGGLKIVCAFIIHSTAYNSDDLYPGREKEKKNSKAKEN